jgi:hypothetical protein
MPCLPTANDLFSRKPIDFFPPYLTREKWLMSGSSGHAADESQSPRAERDVVFNVVCQFSLFHPVSSREIEIIQRMLFFFLSSSSSFKSGIIPTDDVDRSFLRL